MKLPKFRSNKAMKGYSLLGNHNGILDDDLFELMIEEEKKEKYKMTERLNLINKKANECLETYLRRIEEGDMASDELVGILYGGLIAAYLMGFDPEAMIEDAKKSSNAILELVREEDENRS